MPNRAFRSALSAVLTVTRRDIPAARAGNVSRPGRSGVESEEGSDVAAFCEPVRVGAEGEDEGERGQGADAGGGAQAPNGRVVV